MTRVVPHQIHLASADTTLNLAMEPGVVEWLIDSDPPVFGSVLLQVVARLPLVENAAKRISSRCQGRFLSSVVTTVLAVENKS